jgi:cytochrome b subunit of formate dehydrogenase
MVALQSKMPGTSVILAVVVVLTSGSSLTVAGVARGQPSATACLECHGMQGTRAAAAVPDSVSIYLGDWEASVHAGLECTDCHRGISALPHETPLPRADCSGCHEGEAAEYARSVHAARAAAGDRLAPTCASCHDPHTVRPSSDPQSPLHRTHRAEVCTRCHGDANGVGARNTSVPHPAQSYAHGAHAHAMAAGNPKAATCSDCHGSHAVLRARDEESPLHRTNLPRTCGRCHAEEYEAYHAGVHGQAAERGAAGAPVCNDCHGEHEVVRLGEPGQIRVAIETCESCHQNRALVRRYDLPERAVGSYEDSYHGRAARGGLARAAGCTSCHGVHRILAASDTASSIYPGNLVSTCRRCHPQATPDFAASYAHAPRSASAGDHGAGIVRGIYMWLIGVVIGGMLLHNAVLLGNDLRQRWVEHRRRATHVRLNRNEVWQHFVLLTTFTVLVATGFALKYPDTFWARGLSAVGMDEGVRRVVHRIAAAGMILVSLYHVGYLMTARGREQLRHMVPQVRDVREFGAHMAHQLGRTAVPPAFGRFRYIEKAEYWALVWGTAVMVGTGLILWFPERLDGPRWLVRVAEAVHLYEAWLALLAIVVWHLFFVMLRPGTFPLSFTVISGRMDPEELEHEHPEEYRTLYHRALRRPPPGTPVPESMGAEPADKGAEPEPAGDPPPGRG